MIYKKIYLRDMKSSQQLHVVNRSYNLAALDEKKWYLQGTNDLFNEDSEILNQLEDVIAGSYLERNNGEKIYAVISVGEANAKF